MTHSYFSLTGKTAIVTGGGSGIGRAIARRFAAAGSFVSIWDLKLSDAKATQVLIEQDGNTALAMEVDVSDAEAVDSAAKRCEQDHGRIDILVNNAGVSSIGTIEQTPPDELDRVLRVNVSGVANGMRSVVPTMLRQGGGAILNMASIVSLIGVKDRFAYTASKGAVLTMTQSVAIDYVHAGIRCNCICPARIHTPFVDDYIERNYPERKEEVFASLSAYQPVGRMGTPEEVAGLAHYLCSDEASFITGSAFRIDGGVCVMPGL